MDAVNAALLNGAIDRSVPWIKREAVRALSVEYATREGGRDSIAAGLREAYRGLNLDLPDATVDAVVGIFDRNMFPHMRVRWEDYPSHQSHFLFEGCFRCHGSDLRTESGESISDDCNLCHTLVAQGPPGTEEFAFDPRGLPFRHPLDIQGAAEKMDCFECHRGDHNLYLPTADSGGSAAESHGSRRR
jgi:hypothetical protein